MNRQFKLITQAPKPKEVGIGVLSFDRGEAHFFSGFGESESKLLADMTRAQLDFVGPGGIMLSGFERNGREKNGIPKYRFQQWWMAFV